MSQFLRAFLFSLIIFLLLIVAFISGYFYHDQQLSNQSFALLNEAYALLIRHGLNDPPPGPKLEYGMIHGMIQAYGDPYTAFIEPPLNELQTDALEGKFGGIGITLNKDPEGFWVLSPFPDSPAKRAGIKDGDRLLAVDDFPVTPETPLDNIQAAIRGPIGEEVSVRIGRPPDYAYQEFSILREEISLPTVTWNLLPGEPTIGVLSVNLMAASTADEIQRAVKDLQARGARHFILDLRDNPGGYLTAGIDIARLFLEKGIIMQEQYRGKDIETFSVDRPGPLAELPLAILINAGSASAAEIAAGALQAHRRAPLIGVHSFGKDTVQLVFNLKDNSSLHVTSAHWWIPGLEPPLGGIGLQPDILIESTEPDNGVDPYYQAAIEYLLR